MASDFDNFGDLEDLYQQVIIDHSRNPRNFGDVPDADGRAEGYNPLCGDRVSISIRRQDDRIADAGFTGKGCAICTASCSMLTQSIKGASTGEFRAKFERFHRMLTSSEDTGADEEVLGKLAVFAGVKKYPVRVKCATLAWHTLKAALENKDDPVSTE